jgi:hypothetical protein
MRVKVNKPRRYVTPDRIQNNVTREGITDGFNDAICDTNVSHKHCVGINNCCAPNDY